MVSLLQSFNESMLELSSDAPLCVALSGGMDSVVLLHCLVLQKRFLSIRALHINHQLSENADCWQRHCESLCAHLEVPLTSITVDVRSGLEGNQDGLENAARNCRYQAFQENIAAGEILLLAHHADDQYETMLLRLMRGAGVKGLSAIPPRRALGLGYLLRPLLAIPRQQLLDYAQTSQLSWIEDESNQDSRFDRNFCRNEVLPLLARRWPNYRSSWAKSSQLLSEADELMRALAELDMAAAATEEGSVLNLGALQLLAPVRLRNTIRYWLLGLGLDDIGWGKLNAVVDAFASTQKNTKTLLEANDFRLVVHAGNLYALPPKQALIEQVLHWQLDKEECVLPGNGCLRLVSLVNEPAMSIDRARMAEVQIRYRQGGEELKLPGRPTKSLKKLLQEAGIQPWLRMRIPLVFVADQLAFVPEIGVSENYAADTVVRQGVTVKWLRPNFNWPLNEKSN
ncbi:MAG: tRNA(Ile)-lysidine synthase [Pseudohongiellaceae bacterium]|jgi:tRNA(Ile)-lysidine synthase